MEEPESPANFEEYKEPTIEEQMDAVNNTDLPVSEREKIRTKAWILSDRLTAKMSFEEINRAVIAAFPKPLVKTSQVSTGQEEEKPVEEATDPVSTGVDFTEDTDSTAGATRYDRDPTKDPGYKAKTPRIDTDGMSEYELVSAMIFNAKAGYDYDPNEYAPSLS